MSVLKLKEPGSNMVRLLVATGDRVVITGIAQMQQSANIVLPDGLRPEGGRNQLLLGVVTDIGPKYQPGLRRRCEKMGPFPDIKEGDFVYFSPAMCMILPVASKFKGSTGTFVSDGACIFARYTAPIPEKGVDHAAGDEKRTEDIVAGPGHERRVGL